ncbi:helix-turn-helix domain-containing protein [Amycolatopsis cynarae]|uniref:Helix-turn-helix domain-containing protein n=1 Tax=Amycolatopsis cynarae TaxID=2995223 RepID=A0ABY7AY51_9PSEU|nr:helix-turn-helix domain-containing protein [Amycolatopsis sp. HUAS 11-8]WAL64649.1 helix-turn-helix domain-containing protein [Amycolatopsis sp. HUAS 11-8]
MTSRFGTLLRQLRRAAGMTQEQLAERSGVGVRTIRRLETGEPTDPRLGTVKLLADALGLAPDERRRLLAEAGGTPDRTPEAAEEPPGEVPAVPPVHGPVVPPAFREALSEAASTLAQAVSGRWQREEEQRGVHDPFPLPVRWRPMAPELTDHWDNINRAPAGVTSRPLELTGTLDGIAGTYRRIPSGRLVVLGRAGSGKTILALRFVLSYLRTRTEAEPVPVVFDLGSWDPTALALRDWLIDRLLRDYPGLAADGGGGETLAAALVEAGYILPVLDGFDEIANGLHRAALEALNGTALPLLLTSRPGEFARAVAATDVLTGAAGIELTDLTPDDLAGYLPRTVRRAADGMWDPVLTVLRERPDSPAAARLRAVLSTPLMIVLARTVYSDTPGRDPAELLDSARFPTAEALEDHLLDSYVPTVYRHRPPAGPAGRGTSGSGTDRDWDPARARHWLGHLARHLDRLGTHDLAWWQLGTSLPKSRRILTVVLGTSLVTAVFDWLFVLPLDIAASGVSAGLRAGLVEGVLTGAVVGLAFGLVYGILIVYGGVEFEPSRVRMRWFGRAGRTGLARRFTARFGVGLLGGFLVGLGFGPMSTLVRGLLYGFPAETGLVLQVTLVNMFLFGLVYGLAAGAVFGLMAVLEAPMNLSSAANPLGLLAANRGTVGRQVLMLIPMITVGIAVGGRLVIDLFQGALGPLVWTLEGGLLTGAIGGLGGSLCYAFAFTAWGQWVLLSRFWLPLTGRLPWAMAAFLDDAYRRGVLRQAGAVYQFRHARLRDHLTGKAPSGTPGRGPVDTGVKVPRP